MSSGCLYLRLLNYREEREGKSDYSYRFLSRRVKYGKIGKDRPRSGRLGSDRPRAVLGGGEKARSRVKKLGRYRGVTNSKLQGQPGNAEDNMEKRSLKSNYR